MMNFDAVFAMGDAGARHDSITIWSDRIIAESRLAKSTRVSQECAKLSAAGAAVGVRETNISRLCGVKEEVGAGLAGVECRGLSQASGW